MTERTKTAAFALAAAAMAVAASVVEPERYTPRMLSDQGEAFYPQFRDPQTAKTIEVVDYDESTATARPFKVEFQKGRWVIPTHNNYVVDASARLARTAAALVDLKKDAVVSDSVQDHAKYGVVDPMDSKVGGLTGRGKRIVLRDSHGELLADFILGKPVAGKPGQRYVRTPGQKRVYAVKTDADPSARFADWVNADLLRIASNTIRRVLIVSYSIDERMGRLANMEQVQLAQDGGKWTLVGAAKFSEGPVRAMASTLDGLRIIDVAAKPPALAQGLRGGQIELSLEAAMSLRQKGFFLSPQGRLLANEGEMIVETANGVAYTLRFGETTGKDDGRYLMVTASWDAARAAKYGDASGSGERIAKDLSARFADWYYVISGEDFKKLRLKRADLGAPAPAAPPPFMPPASGAGASVPPPPPARP